MNRTRSHSEAVHVPVHEETIGLDHENLKRRDPVREGDVVYVNENA